MRVRAGLLLLLAAAACLAAACATAPPGGTGLGSSPTFWLCDPPGLWDDRR